MNLYTVEQLDHASRWSVIRTAETSGEAQSLMRYYRLLASSTAWRVVERPSDRLIVCEGGSLD